MLFENKCPLFEKIAISIEKLLFLCRIWKRHSYSKTWFHLYFLVVYAYSITTWFIYDKHAIYKSKTFDSYLNNIVIYILKKNILFIFDKILAFLYISYLFYIFCLLGKKVMKYKPNVRSICVYNDICLRLISVFLVHFECTLTCNESMFVLSFGFSFYFLFCLFVAQHIKNYMH